MIKFLRNIRKTMIKENKVTKYLLYAIGEIVLVVIGILIALQINNWNTGRLEKKIEYNLVQKMKEQTIADSVFFHTKVRVLMRQDSIISYVISLNNDTIIMLPNRAFVNSLLPTFRYTTGSNLIRNHSEDFKNISDLKLREELMDYNYLTTMMNGALDLYNQNLQEYLIPLELKYYPKLKAYKANNNLRDLINILKNEDIDSRFNFFKDLNSNAIRQIQNLQEKNRIILEALKVYKANFYY